MSYVQRKAKVEYDIETLTKRVDELLTEISSLEDKKLELENIQKEIVKCSDTLTMMDEIYKEGQQAAEMSIEDVKEVLSDLETSVEPDFKSAKLKLGIEEDDEEDEEVSEEIAAA